MRFWSPFLGLPLWVWLFVLPSLLAVLCIAFAPRVQPVLRPVWRFMDKVYFAAGIVAAIALIAILCISVAQMGLRFFGLSFPGSTKFAGYVMACASFFALAHALTKGAHIRVSIFLNLSGKIARWLDPVAVYLSAIIATYFARFALYTNFQSKMINERTDGLDKVPEWSLSLVKMFGTWPTQWGELWASTGDRWVPTPIWLPQIAMSIGVILLAICLWDMLYRLLLTGENPIKSEAVE